MKEQDKEKSPAIVTEGQGVKKTMALFVVFAIILSIAVLFWADLKSAETSCNIGEAVALSNGVEFRVSDCIFKTEVTSGILYHSAKQGNKYVLIRLEVANNGTTIFRSDANAIYLRYGDAEIAQSDIVKTWSDGYNDIAQNPTTTAAYIAIFEVGQHVTRDNLSLIISHGKWVDKQRLCINLKPNE